MEISIVFVDRQFLKVVNFPVMNGFIMQTQSSVFLSFAYVVSEKVVHHNSPAKQLANKYPAQASQLAQAHPAETAQFTGAGQANNGFNQQTIGFNPSPNQPFNQVTNGINQQTNGFNPSPNQPFNQMTNGFNQQTNGFNPSPNQPFNQATNGFNQQTNGFNPSPNQPFNQVTNGFNQANTGFANQPFNQFSQQLTNSLPTSWRWRWTRRTWLMWLNSTYSCSSKDQYSLL